VTALFEDDLEHGRPPVLRREIRVGDVDTAIVVRLFDLSPNAFDPKTMKVPPPLNVSGAVGNDIQLVFNRPLPASNPPLVVTATFTDVTPILPGQVGDGTDGYIQYRTTAGFLNVEGLWVVQGLVALAPGSWGSQIRSFSVHPNLAIA
jgi:hypothetical protein